MFRIWYVPFYYYGVIHAGQVTILVVWGLVSFVIALRMFRWQ